VSASGASLGVSLDVSAVPALPLGAGRYVVELVRALAGRPEVRLSLLSRRNDADRWARLDPAASIVAAAPAARPLRLAWQELAAGAVVARLPGVAVHHGPHYTLPRGSSAPSVVTVHDCTFLDHPEWHEPSKVLLFSHALRLAARRAAVVVCPSAATAERFRALCAPAGEVLVVPHGVDHSRFTPVEPEPGADAAQLGRLGVRRPFVFHLGTLEPRKDVPTLLRAFGRLTARADAGATGARELSLVLAGPPGWGGSPLEKALGELPVQARSRVVRLGYVEDGALPALLRASSAFVYASHEEGFGVPVLEALACGAPVVTSQGTVMAEVAAGAAVLSAPGDVASLAGAIEAVLAGGKDAEWRRQAGLASAATMTWAASADGHIAAYRLAAGSTGSSPPH
jgi:glycosyltransferase involved in cell wall biosynthesis